MSQVNNARMLHFPHDLQLPVLVPLVLVDLLDGDILTCFDYGCLEIRIYFKRVDTYLEHNSERPITHNSVGIVGEA